MRFIRRGRTTADPQALDAGALWGTAGAVLDPVAAICRRIALDPMADRVFATAPAHGQAILSGLHAGEADAQLYARLAGNIIYANASLRAD